MKEYLLNYYNKFKCIADKCKHTCCAGWEMCIDKQTLNAYKNDNSPFSKTLKKGINFKKSKFKADESGRCAFLNDNGLCDIIINLGEQSLCQVCKDHPRFRSFFENSIETGLGFSCEQATKIILSFEDKIQPVLIKDDKAQKETPFIEGQVLAFREKAIGLIQDRTIDINQRIKSLLSLCYAQISDNDFEKISTALACLERLDEGWKTRLTNVEPTFYAKQTNQALSLCAEQFLVNSLYRHLSDAEDTMWVRARAIACVFFWFVVNGIYEKERTEQKDFALVCDIVRAFSAEVEYSQKNLNELFEFAFEFIKL